MNETFNERYNQINKFYPIFLRKGVRHHRAEPHISNISSDNM